MVNVKLNSKDWYIARVIIMTNVKYFDQNIYGLANIHRE